jgi:chemotaxis protein histidine kinase CheA
LAAFFSDETLLYAEVPAPEAVVQKLLQHPTVATALELDAVKPNLRSPEFLAFKTGLTLVEASLGGTWPELVADLGGAGIAAAVLPGENRFVVIMQARDEARLKKAAESLLNLIALQARNEGRDQPWRIESRGAAKIAIFDGFAMVRSGVQMVLATRIEDAEAAIKRLEQPAANNSLASTPAFQAARQKLHREHSTADAFLWANLESIRAAGLAPALDQSVSDNPVAELLLGGWLVALGSNPSASVVLQLDDSHLRVEALTDYRSEMAAGPRDYWFGEAGTGQAPQWIAPNAVAGSTAMQLTSYRDLGQWWLNKEALFTDAMIANLVQADSQLSTVFGGLDFGGEVLGAFEPGVQILVSSRPGSNLDPAAEPAAGSLQIPGFAIIGQLREPRQTTRRFKVAFQSLMGFVNLGLAQSGLPQYDVDTRTTPQGCECVSRIWIEDDSDVQSPVYSFSPSLLITDGRMVLGSDAAWVQALANTPQAVSETPAVEAASVPKTAAQGAAQGTSNTETSTATVLNTHLDLDWQIIVQLLKLNRETLVAQNMIENGNSRLDAGRDIDNLLQALELISRFDFRLETTGNQMRMVGRIDWATTPPTGITPEDQP